MTIRFDCTMCGRCCHGLRLPLGMAEAVAWLRDGNDVQLFCEAIPWPSEPPADHLPAMHKRRRSFGAMSGPLPVRVIVTLMASFDGPCPNLQPDMRCGIYERRPTTCRIYPAEVNPFIALEPKNKLCPPEAWEAGDPIRFDDGRWADAELAGNIALSRETDAAEAALKQRVCALLDCATAALSNEGMVVHSPPRDAVLAALQSVLDAGAGAGTTSDGPWRLVTNRAQTLGALREIGSWHASAQSLPGDGVAYLGYFEADIA